MAADDAPSPAPEPPEAAPPKRRSLAEAGKDRPWLLAGTLLGGLGTLLAAVVSGIALFVSDGNNASGPTPSPPPDEPQRTARAAPETPYTFTQPPLSHEGIRVSVPDQWPLHRLARWHAHGLSPIAENTPLGPGVNAAVSIREWAKPSAPAPGVFVGVSTDPALLRFSPRELLATIDLEPCRAGPIEDDTSARGSAPSSSMTAAEARRGIRVHGHRRRTTTSRCSRSS